VEKDAAGNGPVQVQRSRAMVIVCAVSELFKAKSVPRLNSEIRKSNELPSLKGWLIFSGDSLQANHQACGQEYRKKIYRPVEKTFLFRPRRGESGIF
jgi:hypothetical protein